MTLRQTSSPARRLSSNRFSGRRAIAFETLEERTLLATLFTFVGGNLASVDPDSAATSIIGPTGVGSNPGLDFSPDGTLQGVRAGKLQSFDIDTGAGTNSTTISPNLGSLPSFAYSPDGRLFAATNSTDALWEIDVDTGAATEVGPLGVNLGTSGMDFTPDGTLYLIEGSKTGSLYTVDVATGGASLIGSLGFDFFATDLAISFDGTIYGTGSGIAGFGNGLFTVDPDTGAGTIIGSMGFASPAALGWGPNTFRGH